MEQETLLSEVLSEFARTMLTDFPIQAILDHLVSRMVEILPVTSAGVTLISPGRDPQYIAASDDDALMYERLQSQVGEGPCLKAYHSGEAVSIPELSLSRTFPKFGPLAVEAGLAAVFTFPLRHGKNPLGALDLYRQTPGGLDDQTMQVAQTLADVVAAYLLNAQARESARRSAEEYRESALHDALTGLPNRVLLHQRLEHAALRARRSKKMLAILFIDLDRFKEINDIYGHRSGDELLVAVAERVQGLVRPGDTVARMSGDEFVVLCEDLNDPVIVGTLAERLVTGLGSPFTLSSAVVNVSASVGIAFAGPASDVPDDVLNDADEAMYQAKRAGGARHQLIDLRERTVSADRISLEHDLHHAATRGELRVEYQPIVRTGDGETTGMEALLRWDHPTLGLVAPTIVIPLAERSELISEIGRWVLTRACSDRVRLQQLMPERVLHLCVNVSPHQLMQQGYSESVADVLFATGTDPRRLTLEVTESVYVEDSDRALIVLEDLKKLGVEIALDDFGTGFSSLSHLQQFPIDIVKIDRQFIAKLGREPVSHSIVKAVITLAHDLGRDVVAEGVETEDQYKQVALLGGDYCQGFYFSPPMSASDFEHRLRSELHQQTSDSNVALTA